MVSLDIGAIRLTSLDDGSFPFPAGEFFAGVPEALWRAGLQAGADGKILVGHNCGLVGAGRELILVDTGYGDDTHEGRTGHLLAELGRAGVAPADVSMVVNTHAHGDHAGRNTVGAEGAPAFPCARYFLARADWDHFNGPAGAVHHVARNFAALTAPGRLTLFDGALQLAPGVALLPTPGLGRIVRRGNRLCLGAAGPRMKKARPHKRTGLSFGLSPITPTWRPARPA